RLCILPLPDFVSNTSFFVFFLYVYYFFFFFFFFSSRRRHTRSYGDWSSDVCSSDLSSFAILRTPLVSCDPSTVVKVSAPMEKKTLGRTGLRLPIVSFGASSLGQEFRKVTLDEALRSVQVALDCGLNFIDTSPFYGRGMSEV